MSDGWNNPWKLTAIGMGLVMVTALVTGVVVGGLPSRSDDKTSVDKLSADAKAPVAKPAAAPAAPVEPVGRTVATRVAVSMDQAVKMVEQRFHARVVKAEAQKDDGRTVYVLRLLNDSGKVWTVRVDASDGSVQ